MKAATPEAWTRLWREINAQTDPLPVYQELLWCLVEPIRYYHNLRHIDDCLAEFDPFRTMAREPAAVELAIWFHDAVYDSQASDNEEKNAELARQRLSEAAVDPSLRASVVSLVMATKTHDPSLHPDAPLLVDVDLSILGKPPAQFEDYETSIRCEYAWVPQATFVQKRAEILQRFLDRKRIYSIEAVFARYERQARENLAESIRKLKSQPAAAI